MGEKIRILRILNRFNLGGPAYHVGYLTSYLEAPFETLLVGGPPLPHEASALPFLHQLGVQPQVITSMGPSLNPIREFRSLLTLRRLIHSYKPHIIHTHVTKAGLTGRFSALLANYSGILVHTFHGHHFHGYTQPLFVQVYQKIERFLTKRTHVIITISPHLYEDLVQRYRIALSDQVRVIPLGLDLERFREDRERKGREFRAKWNISPEAIVISIVGRLVPIKNHRFFIEAFDALRQENSQVPLVGVVVGDGPLRTQLEKEVQERQLQFNGKEGILFTSWYREVDEVYASSDLVVLTSISEGTPVSLIEAQAAGKPVVATEAGGTAFVVRHEETGFIVPQGNLQLFVHYLHELIHNPGLRTFLGQNAEKHAFASFHYKRLVRDIRNLYFALLRKHEFYSK